MGVTDDKATTVNLGTFQFTASKPDGSLDGDIVNQSGSTLPSTGGMGTTIFYVIGGILVLAAVIVLISKRRVQQ
jgi:LPXTG-motif cell wall-anchored protein